MAVTLTIGTASRMYTTWAAAEAAIPADISSSGANTPYILEAYNDSEFTGSGTILTLSGITTDSTNTITCTCAPGQSWSDNPSRQTNRVDYVAANGVGLNASGFFSQPISCSVANVIFAGLQVTSNAFNNTTLSTSGSVVQNCILKCASSGGSITPFQDNSGSNSKILNSVLINNNNAYGAFMIFGGLIANSTIVAPTGGSAGGVSVYTVFGTVTVNNTALFGFGGAFVSGTYVGSNNCTDQTFAPGTSNLLSKTFANQFVHTADDGSLDLKLKTGADCIDAGFTDTTDIPSATDAVGTSRPQGTAWDIGAWEFVIATGVTINAAPGMHSWAGVAANTSQIVSAMPGGYSFSGLSANTSQLINAGTGAYSWAGKSGTINQVIAASTGSYSWAGLSSSIIQAISSTPGTITWSGIPATVGSAITGIVGAYSWSGTIATRTQVINAASGTYSWTAPTATISQVIAAQVGAYAWSGSTATQGQVINGLIGAYSWAGVLAGIFVQVQSAPGAYTWAGVTASIPTVIPQITGSFVWAGVLAGVPTIINAAVGAYGWAGITSSRSISIASTSGMHSWTGTIATLSSGIQGIPGTYSWQGITAGLAATAQPAQMTSGSYALYNALPGSYPLASAQPGTYQ